VQTSKFAINFFTSIGLGPLTEGMRAFLKDAPDLISQQKYQMLLEQVK